MTETIQYKNSFGALITKEQAQLSGEYQKFILVNNTLKIRESYSSNRLKKSYYYMDNNENLNSLIAQYSSHEQEASFIEKVSEQNGFKVFAGNTYLKGVLTDKTKWVQNIQGYTIMMQWIDINTNLVRLTEKRHRDANDDAIYIFEYNDNGVLTWVHDEREDHGGSYEASTLNDPEVNFDWTGLSYFQAAAPIIPQ